MKKLFFSLIALIAVSVSSSFATDYSGILNTNGTTRIFSGSGTLSIVQITADSVAPVTVTFYDAATNVTTYIDAAYTTFASYVTNLTTYYTNTQGFIQTNTRSALWTYSTTVAAVTNTYPVVSSVTVPASGTIVRTYTPAVNFARGLTVNCVGTNVTANISYQQ